MTAQLDTIDLNRTYTVQEFMDLDFPEDDENEYELIGGKIVAKTQGSTSGRHGDIVVRLSTKLDVFAGVSADEKRLGKVYSGASCTLANNEGENFPKPDVCFVLSGRTPAEFDGPIPVAPDLAVEVWSPSDSEGKKFEKIQAYQQAGVRLIWSISMLERFVAVYRANGSRSLLDLDDELSGEDVIPGFTLKIRALFED